MRAARSGGRKPSPARDGYFLRFRRYFLANLLRSPPVVAVVLRKPSRPSTRHKYHQTMSTPWRVIYTSVCLSGLYETASLPLPPHLAAGGPWQFLTNVSLLITCAVATLRIAVDILWHKRAGYSQFNRLIKLAMLACVHLEFVVTGAYWFMIMAFPSLLNGDSFDVSWLLDFKIHLFPYVFLLADTLYHGYYDRYSIVVTEAFLAVYWTAIEVHMWVHRDQEILFPYPFLNDKYPWERLMLLLVFGLMAALDYLRVGFMQGTPKVKEKDE